ncbi:AprI/Inh family metalloprotease inhibitor [Methylobacterium sp. J-068]|uniref:AprI/Inh family metalloprotease inhibitor n=1 Tax=Methylobacterium sp. J-068 TaxID=2836649 RepID=UPI001FBBA315|nr:AprI/Inh family metalloprotease inhibitor [Methylobacterium sp. J-068]MCJ2033974.1 protease inhibitor Inh/omp19 family protein [Methylobacterium sp. J-068]
MTRLRLGLLTGGAVLALQMSALGQEPGQNPGPDTAPDAAKAPFIESLPRDIAGVPGTWDLSRDGSTRRCVMTLSGESGPSGRRLSFPAGCRRALPILNGVAGWLFSDGNIRLVDKDVRPVLQFTRRADARSLLAPGATGETFSLVPLQIVAMMPPTDAVPTSPGAGSAAPDARIGTGRTEPGPARDAPAPGIYALDRYREQDVCRIELTDTAPPAPVRILDNCRDSGLSVFDPVSWRFDKGRMTLTARRGHVVTLVPTGDGRWRRDPEVGTTFVLRKVDAATP